MNEYTRKLCLDIIGKYNIYINGNNKHLILKATAMNYSVMGWFETTKYYNKRGITITNLVETIWLTRYLWPTKITYDQGSYLIVIEFKNYPIHQEFGIKSTPSSSINPTPNGI